MALPLDAALTAVRIADRRRPLVDGQGAVLYGGRWHSPGRKIIYASMTHAGAMLEIIAHANTLRVPGSLVWAEITIPRGASIEEVTPRRIPGWDRLRSRTARDFGDAWYDSQRSLVLIVPSAVSRPDKNVLINQSHPEFSKVSCGPVQRVEWDRRILESLKRGRSARKG